MASLITSMIAGSVAHKISVTEEAIRSNGREKKARASRKLALEAQANFRESLQAELAKIDRATEEEMQDHEIPQPGGLDLLDDEVASAGLGSPSIATEGAIWETPVATPRRRKLQRGFTRGISGSGTSGEPEDKCPSSGNTASTGDMDEEIPPRRPLYRSSMLPQNRFSPAKGSSRSRIRSRARSYSSVHSRLSSGTSAEPHSHRVRSPIGPAATQPIPDSKSVLTPSPSHHKSGRPVRKSTQAVVTYNIKKTFRKNVGPLDGPEFYL
ncbi:hypothetical protein F5Y19DRAFT_480967 [Xylariaceae sp. FL1651]|nr:hypothetical protein F5Y19DRAFT_480967 [Xylariaceae sp. FL1651]